MRKYLSIVLGILLALLCAVSCGKQDGDDEQLPGMGGQYNCFNEETGYTWFISLSRGGYYLTVRNSKGNTGFSGSCRWTQSMVDFIQHQHRIPADKSASGQDEYYLLIHGDLSSQNFVVSYRVRIGEDGNWSTNHFIFTSH